MATRYCALLGESISQSYSPYFHRQFAKQCGIDLVYEKIPVNDKNFHFAWIKFVTAGGMGANITMPCKKVAHTLCTRLSKAAKQAGSVNTIYLESETEWYGDNTDGVGFIRDLVDYYKHSLRGRQVLLLGAGGAAYGLLPAILQQEPASVTISNRTLSHAEKLAAKYKEVKACDFSSIPNTAFDCIINTSAELPLAQLNFNIDPAAVAYDIRYTSVAQSFVQWAKQKGARFAYDGYGMLLEQAAASFAVWFGVHPITTMLRQKPIDMTQRVF